jgi:Flp pilus assembly protein TadG
MKEFLFFYSANPKKCWNSMRKKPLTWTKNEDGATAIEFSLVAIPFIFMMVGILEMALMYTSASLVEGGTGVAAREIRTCALQDSTEVVEDQEVNFRKAFCDHAVTLRNCEEDLFVEVVAMPDDSFTSISDYEAEFDEDGAPVSRGFDPGYSSDVVLVRTAYRYSFLTPWLGTVIAGPNSSMLLMSTTVLQVEPCEFEGAAS